MEAEVSALRKELGVNLAAGLEGAVSSASFVAGDVLRCSSLEDLEQMVAAAAAAPATRSTTCCEGTRKREEKEKMS